MHGIPVAIIAVARIIRHKAIVMIIRSHHFISTKKHSTLRVYTYANTVLTQIRSKFFFISDRLVKYTTISSHSTGAVNLNILQNNSSVVH